MNDSIIRIQRNVRESISLRYKHSIFLTIMNLSNHLVRTNQNVMGLYEIANKFVNSINTTFGKWEYEELWSCLENLRKQHGGYYVLIFVPYDSVDLFDTHKMWICNSCVRVLL